MQEENLIFSYCTMVNQKLFFVDDNGLPLMMNPENGEVSYCPVMDNFNQEGKRICAFQFMDDKVYALGTSGEIIIVFDLKKSECQYIPLQCSYRNWGNFVGFERYGSNLYIFPRYGNKICVLNALNHKVVEIAFCFDGRTELQCACRAGNKVWLLPCNESAIGCFDLTCGEMQIYEMQKKIENCADAAYVDGNIYILNRFGIIYILNIEDFELREVKTLETKPLADNTMGRIVYAANKLIILPSLAEEIKILDIPTGKTEIYRDYPEDFLYYDMEYMKQRSKYTGLCEDDSYYYCAMRRENYLLKINKRDGNLLWVKPNVPLGKERMKVLNFLKEKKFNENFAAGKRYFVEADVNIDMFLGEVQKIEYADKESTVGKAIFKAVKE